MTCIVGVEHEGVVYIGADSAATDEWDIQFTRNDSKIFKREGFLFGFCGSYRVGQLLRYGLKIPEHDGGVDVMKYLVTSFVEAVHQCFNDGDLDLSQDKMAKHSEFLIGYQGKLYLIAEDRQVASAECKYVAIGSGAQIAIGSLHSSDFLEGRPEQRVFDALKAAAFHCASVSEPLSCIEGG